MSRHADQRGAALVMIIGVIAVLAVLAATLVMVTANAMQGTAADRERAQAFNLAEGALDKAMNVLSARWPDSSAIYPQVDPTEFWHEFAYPTPLPTPTDAVADQYAPPVAGGDRTSVEIYDNSAARDHWDANGDKIMWVEAQGDVGVKKARVRAQVIITPGNLNLPPGAIQTPGSVLIKGASGVTAEVLAPGSNQAGIYCSNWNDGTAVQKPPLPTQVALADNTDLPPALSADELGYLKTVAQSSLSPKRYFTYADWIAWTATLPADADMEGVFYVDAPGQTVMWPSSLNYNHTGDGVSSTDASGNVLKPCLLVVNAALLTWQSNAPFYGVVYCSGQMDFQGTPDIHGMLISDSPSTDMKSPAIDLAGDYALTYNDNVRQNLLDSLALNVKIVQDTWQEIAPQ
jgi:type II secretory pathway pseudopilin PulG